MRTEFHLQIGTFNPIHGFLNFFEKSQISMSSSTRKDYIYAYRGLYRALLHAVQYAKPARYMGRNMLREEFRKGDPATFDLARINNTIKFLDLATKETGLEHKLVKNLLRVKYERGVQWKEYINLQSHNVDCNTNLSPGNLGRRLPCSNI